MSMELVETFLNRKSRDIFLNPDKGYKPEKTLLSYRKRLSKFFKYFKAHDVEAVKKITIDDIKSYQMHRLEVDGIDRSSLNTDKIAIKSFYRDMANLDIGIENITKELKVKVIKKDQPCVTRQHKNIILDLVKSLRYKNQHYFQGYIFIGIFKFFGVRINSALNLDTTDIGINEKGVTIKFIGKGKKENIMFLPFYIINEEGDKIRIPETQEFGLDLAKYKDSLSIGPLFRSRCKNKDGTPKRWHENSARDYFNKILKLANLTGLGYTIHALRRAFASHKLEDGVSLKELQILLDHANIETTARYLYSDDNRVKSSMTKGL